MPELKQTIYVETTIPSYLTAWPSGDVIRAGHQEVTRQWWKHAMPRFRLVISDAVMAEISVGDPAAAAERIEAVQGLPILSANSEVFRLTHVYEQALLLPPKAKGDLLHFAFSVAYNVEQLITWNCAHIANPHVIRKLEAMNDTMGLPTPIIQTPEYSLAGM